MPEKKVNIEEEVRKTLSEPDRSRKLPPDPYFYTRLHQKLEDRHKKKITFQTVLKPALLTLIIVANLGTVIWQYNEIENALEKERQKKIVEVFLNQPEDQDSENVLGLN